MPVRPATRCSTCRQLHSGKGKCAACRRLVAHQVDQARGTSTQRGYDRTHATQFRAAVLGRDPVCVHPDGCRQPSTHADHWPRSRRTLARRGLDPNDPRYGRGLCAGHHNAETARHQPGGWNAR